MKKSADDSCCEMTEFGCCESDGVSTKADINGTNCEGYVDPAPVDDDSDDPASESEEPEGDGEEVTEGEE